MMGITDFFTPEAGQRRRAWLNSVDDSISEAARYYLGPTGLPERASAAASVAGMFSPGADMMDAAESSRNLMRAQSPLDAATAGAGLAAAFGSMLLPGSADDAARALSDFAADESGALRLFHGSGAEFDAFDFSKAGRRGAVAGFGHNLSDSESLASAYARQSPTPYMYEVGVRADTPDFLDLHATIDAQSPSVQRALEAVPEDLAAAVLARRADFGRGAETDPFASLTGRDLVKYLSHAPVWSKIPRFPGDEGLTVGNSRVMNETASRYLRHLGVPGTTGVDATAPHARNYVLFGDDLLDILSRKPLR